MADHLTNRAPIKKLRKKKLAIKGAERYGTIKGAAHEASVSRDTIYRWMQEDSEFASAIEGAKEQVADRLEESLVRCAEEKENTTAAIFMLKALRPEKYRERREIVQHQKTQFEFRVAGKSREQVRAEVHERIQELKARLESLANR